MTELIIAVSFAIIISAGCSLFESVLYSVPTRHIETMVQAGKSTGKLFKKMRRDIDRPIAAILSLNTIAHTAGAAVAGSAASAVFGYEWLGFFSVFFTLAVLVFAEIIPKTAGVVYCRSLVPKVAYPLRGLVWFMTPAIWLSGLITRLFTGDKSEEEITAEEIRVMARLSLQTGGIKPYQEQAIENILTLQNKQVKDVMTPRTVIFSLSEHLTVEEASKVDTNWSTAGFPCMTRTWKMWLGSYLQRNSLWRLLKARRTCVLLNSCAPFTLLLKRPG